jgi:hypothetical protein
MVAQDLSNWQPLHMVVVVAVLLTPGCGNKFCSRQRRRLALQLLFLV